mgnify:CR=1 FL=1
MRKTLSGLITFSLLLIPTQFLNASTIKAGTSCAKLGQTQTINGYEFTCSRSGKKLIWDKGVSVKKSTPTASISPSPIISNPPSPTPSSSPTLSPTPIPSPAPSIQKYLPTPGPSQSISTLYGLADPIELKAFSELTNYQKSQPELSSGSLQLDISPHASKELSDATYKDLLRGVQFWQKYTSSNPKVHMVFADRLDMDWFKDKMIAIQPNNTSWLDRIYNLAKDNPLSAYGGANSLDSNGNVLFFFLPGTATRADSPGWLGVGPHEWTHQAQYTMSGDINKAPCWFKEGQATYFGNAISNNELASWATNWKTQIQSIKYDLPTFKAMARTDLQKWFETHELNMPNNVCGPDGAFIIGGITVEYLVGAYGLDALNEFLFELKNGIFWKDALANVASEPIEVIMKKIIDFLLKIRDWAQIP